MHRLPRIRNKGFTMVEMLVAVAILVIVIGSIYGAFRAGNQSSVMIEESADLNQTARVLLSQISTELCSMYNRAAQKEGNLKGENSELSGGPPYFDKLTFTTVSHKPNGTVGPRGDVCTVTYSAEYDANEKPTGLFVTEDYTPDLHTATVTADSLPAIQLSPLVTGMDCSYLDPDTGDWEDQWVDKSTPPTAVRVELILQSPRKGTKPITIASTTNIPSWSSTQNSSADAEMAPSSTSTGTSPANGGIPGVPEGGGSAR